MRKAIGIFVVLVLVGVVLYFLLKEPSCDAGKYLDENSGECLNCPEGYYCKDNDKEECPDDKTSSFGSSSESDCENITCDAGKYLDGNKCSNCPANYYCKDNNKTQCPGGKTSSSGSSSESDCEIKKTETATCTCTNGVCGADKSKCISCNTGYKLVGSNCTNIGNNDIITCTCTNGVCGTDKSKCVSCNNGYCLNDDACVLKATCDDYNKLTMAYIKDSSGISGWRYYTFDGKIWQGSGVKTEKWNDSTPIFPNRCGKCQVLVGFYKQDNKWYYYFSDSSYYVSSTENGSGEYKQLDLPDISSLGKLAGVSNRQINDKFETIYFFQNTNGVIQYIIQKSGVNESKNTLTINGHTQSDKLLSVTYNYQYYYFLFKDGNDNLYYYWLSPAGGLDSYSLPPWNNTWNNKITDYNPKNLF